MEKKPGRVQKKKAKNRNGQRYAKKKRNKESNYIFS